MSIIDINKFESDNDNITWAKAVEHLKNHPGTVLNAVNRTFNITGEIARKTMNDVIGMKYGKNPEKEMFRPDFPYDTGIAFENIEDCTINMYGSKLMIDGFMEPVSIKHCKNFEIEGIAIDHKRKPYSKGIIIESERLSDNVISVTAQFSEDYPLNDNADFPRYVLFDCYANRFVGYGEVNISNPMKVSHQTFEFTIENPLENLIGMELYCWHTFHSRPAIFIENSKNVKLQDVTIHSQPGMGVVAHRNDELKFNGLNVVPSAGEHMSTNTDAVHITSCKGDVVLENCRFDGQGDDSLNIHTYYHRIEKLSGKKCRIYLDSPTKTHSQTPDYPDIGDILELTDFDSLSAVDTYCVTDCKVSADTWSSEVTLDKKLPDNCGNHVFANQTQQPHLIFRYNFCRNHLARGVLVKVKKAHVCDNTFVDVVGTCVYVAAESWWREGVCTTDSIVIKRNRIVYAGRTNSIRQCDTAGICVTVDADNANEKTHKNVIITDNIVDCPDSPVGIYVSNTNYTQVENNSINVKNTPIIIKD